MSESGRGAKNIVWEYFDKVDDENKEAECKLCHSVLNYRSTSHNLKNHLKHKHNEIVSNIPTPETPAKVIKIRKSRASVWEYFEIYDNEKKFATCNECQRTISYKTTTANLKTHLRRAHKQKYDEMEGLDEEDQVYLEDEGDESDANDDVWSFFERAGGEARCAVCRAMVPVAALRSHLRNNHPKLVDVVESEEETSNNTQEDVYTEVVYLEHEDSPKITPKPVEKPRKPIKNIHKSTKKRRVSSSSDEEPLQHKKIRNDDEIEQFGKYVTCLLKKIPQETSMELQMDIVNLIMKKQLELKRNKSSVLVGQTKMAAVQTADGGSQTSASYEIKISDGKNLSNGYSYSIEKIVNDETVQSNE